MPHPIAGAISSVKPIAYGGGLPWPLANMKSKIPTEREVLREIYEMYKSQYPFKPEDGPIGQVFIPLDLDALSINLNVDKHLLFGYLDTHLDHKYCYKTGENSYVRLFSSVVGGQRYAINFPYLAAILAERDQEHSKFAWSLGVSLVALALSVGAIVAQLVSAK